MHRIALAVLLLPAVATADPDPARLYGQAAIGFGGASVENDDRQPAGPQWELAAGYQIGGSDSGGAWIHGALGWIYGNWPDAGRILEPHAGIEWRTHGEAASNGFIGIDVGMLSGSSAFEDFGSSTISGEFAMPRAGLELGGDHVRFQLSFEYFFGHGNSTFDQQASTGGGNEEHMRYSGLMRGGNILLGLVIR